MTEKTIYIASCTLDGGIAHCVLDANHLLQMRSFTEMDRPMFLAKDSGFLWSVMRAPEGYNGCSAVSRNWILPDGSLGETEQVGSTKGVVACHLYVDNSTVYCVNYLSGSVIKLPDKLAIHSGSGPNAERQQSPHTHFVGPVPGSRLLCVTDLGIDSIFFYDHDLNLQDIARVPSGYGARHVAFSPDGGYLYCVNELASCVSVFLRTENGWQYLESYSTLPDGYAGKSEAAAIRVSDGGRYLYVSNRGHNSIAWMEFRGDKLRLCGTVGCQGDWPRDINLYGNVLLCANERSDEVTVFELSNGKPEFTGQKLSVKTPLCIL
jgi:6-phosphogluconolactonase